MRSYPTNSHEALIRIVAAVLLADGSLDASEIDYVQRKHVTETLGVSEAEFERVVREYCDDLLTTGMRSANFQRSLSLEVFDRLLSEVKDNVSRLHLISMLTELIAADGDVSSQELLMIGFAMVHWGADFAGLGPKRS